MLHLLAGDAKVIEGGRRSTNMLSGPRKKRHQEKESLKCSPMGEKNRSFGI